MMMHKLKGLTSLIALLLLVACSTKKDSFRDFQVYVFLGHTYNKSSVIDERIPMLRNVANQVWLGGDIIDGVSKYKKVSSLSYLNSIIDLKSRATHWSFGNHEQRFGIKQIVEFTKKPSYYATFFNGITLINLNSNLLEYEAGCEERNAQADFAIEVLDSVKQSAYVVLLSHHVIWEEFSEDNIKMNDYANSSHSKKFMYCAPNLTPFEVLSPAIQNLLKQDKKVIFLSGDFGQKNGTYEFHNRKNDMVFLGNGILARNKHNQKFKRYNTKDSMLVFYHFKHSKKLNWRFIPLN